MCTERAEFVAHLRYVCEGICLACSTWRKYIFRLLENKLLLDLSNQLYAYKTMFEKDLVFK